MATLDDGECVPACEHLITADINVDDIRWLLVLSTIGLCKKLFAVSNILVLLDEGMGKK